ncbi:arsenate reductase family protein [Robiginitalea aurantiaca]|uniref:ArsC/Spx/MgsR family protein n=1 Tax=Robiginitalea aurantiaca TaxID=3056915 RepID=A0ABT7WED2_9FLAO|nr:ArsC/Spx/MgsR family protein [Robiginitalea aurantiaca]MDM9631271.1 ArsC/Spx/MgsR family protein [Robiginitalea aurantiaca]
MKKFYYLSTCDTCKRILNELALPGDFIMQDIKSDPITAADLEIMRDLAGSYEALFSKRARLYKERNLKNQALGEPDYKRLILEHYTFLKRPVTVLENQIFVGNAAKTVAAAKEALHS